MSERDPDAPCDPQPPERAFLVPVRESFAGGGAEPEPARPGSEPHGRPGRPRRIPRPFVPAPLPRPRPAGPEEPDVPPTEHGRLPDRLAARRTGPLRGGRGVRGLAWLLALGLQLGVELANPHGLSSWIP